MKGWLVPVVVACVLAGLTGPALAQAPVLPDAASSTTPARQSRVGYELREHPSFDLGGLRLNVEGRFDMVWSTPLEQDRGDRAWDIGRQRVGVSGSLFDTVAFQLERDLDGRTTWRDAFVSTRVPDWLRLQAGQFKMPFGRARTTSALRHEFIHRPLAAQTLSPGRHLGAMAEGTVFGRRLSYEAGLFTERTDEYADQLPTEHEAGSTVAVRVTTRPFRGGPAGVRGLEVGAAATLGERPEGLGSVAGRTVVDRAWFFPAVYVKGMRRRTGYELSWSVGRVTFSGEHVELSEERREQGLRGEDLAPLVSRGWYGSAVWLVFGDRRPGRLPQAIAPIGGRAGALELVVRTEELSFSSAGDGPALRNPRAANVYPSVHQALTVGVNWYVSRFARLQGNLVGERLSDAARSPVGSTGRFWAAVARLQVYL